MIQPETSWDTILQNCGVGMDKGEEKREGKRGICEWQDPDNDSGASVPTFHTLVSPPLVPRPSSKQFAMCILREKTNL